MTGEPRCFLDTNAIVALLQGHRGLLMQVESADWVGTSIINVVEFLSFPRLSEVDRALFQTFVSRIHVIDLVCADEALLAEIQRLRSQRAVKLPDAIVLASAGLQGAVLLTRDEQLHRIAAAVAGTCAVLGF